jgi:hypothetical protein
MWTDFNGGDLRAMETARSLMNDYRLIYNPDDTPFTPRDSIALHENFSSKLLNWFGKNLSGPRVVMEVDGRSFRVYIPKPPANWRTGMNFTTPLPVDLAYANTLISAALKGTSLPHF